MKTIKINKDKAIAVAVGAVLGAYVIGAVVYGIGRLLGGW